MKKLVLFVLLFVLAFPFWAQDRFDKESVVSPSEIKQAISEVKQDSVESKQGFVELVKDLKKIEGLFTVYRNNEDGTVYLQIDQEQFGKIYLCTMTRQSGDAYMFDASSMLWNFPFFFKKINKKIQLVQKNLDFRATDPAMKRAIKKSISNSIIASTSIVGKPHPDTGAILIKASDLFLRDMANVETVTDHYKQNVSFDKDNSYFGDLKSFSMNTELDVVLHYKSSKWRDVYTLPDSRSMIHRYHYSLSKIPDTTYRSRLADDRIGCFTTIYQNYDNLLSDDIYTRYINRWHLEKAKPKAKLSKPKEPIVFWLENTIPEEFKPAVRKGILLWNTAFEKIGIKDAIVVKEMPVDADWDPADARYNTICWIVQPGGGYAVGPSHANPYTGQLYDADIRISIDFIRFYANEFGQIIEPGFYKEGYIPGDPTRMNDNRYYEGDNFAQGLAQQMEFGWNLLSGKGVFGKTPQEMKEFIDQGITALVVHEVGHTLGFRHNFKASTYYDSAQLQDSDFTEANGITGSVMDYTPVNLAPVGGSQGSYFQTVLGSWDYFTVKYAYSIFNEKEEKAELAKIAATSSERLHDYGTDEDSHGRGARGMDPTCNTFDLGKDNIKTYGDRLELVRQWWKDIPQNFEKEGQSFSKMRNVFSQGWGEYRNAASNVSKYIGGIYTHRDHIGDVNYRDPYEMIPASRQKEALNFLLKNMLATDAFYFQPSLLNKLVPDKNPKFTGGIWDYKRPDYPIHSKISWIQSIIFSHVYNPIILARLQDNELKYEKSSDVFDLSLLFQMISDEIWQELVSAKNINSYRRNLQKMHIAELKKIVLAEDGIYPNDAVALARLNLTNIRQKLAEMDLTQYNLINQAHLQMLSDNIQSILSANLQKPKSR